MSRNNAGNYSPIRVQHQKQTGDSTPVNGGYYYHRMRPVISGAGGSVRRLHPTERRER
jgi:hypothetical protein